MKPFIKYASLLSLLVLGLFMMFGNVEFVNLFHLAGAAGGTTTLMAIAAGVTTENMASANSEVLDNPYEKMMTIIRPDDYPMDQLIRNTKKAHEWSAWKVTFPSVETRPLTDTSGTANTAASENASLPTKVINVSNSSQWLVDDIVRFNGVNGWDSTPFTGQVTARGSGTITIFAINGTGSTQKNGIPVIPEGTTLTRLGNAKHETDAQNEIYNAVPSTDYNYMQIHMGQIEESVLYEKHTKNIEYDKALQRLLAMYNYRNEAELSALFGKRNMVIDPDNQTKYFAGGAEQFITNTYTYGTATNTTKFSESDWISIAKNVFTGNSGSSRRVLFAGKDLIQRISVIDTVSKQLTSNEVEIIWGVRFRKVMTEYGEFLVKYHKMFDFAGYAGKGMVIDFTNVDKYVFEKFQKTPIEKDKTGSSRVTAERFHETSCFAFKYPDTHAIIDSYS